MYTVYNMFDKFDTGARKVIITAQQEASMTNSRVITTEHLLLGIILGRYGMFLKGGGFDVDVENLRSVCRLRNATSTESENGVPDSDSDSANTTFTAEETSKKTFTFSKNAKQALKLSTLEALSLGTPFVDEGTLFIGITRANCGGLKFLQTIYNNEADLKALIDYARAGNLNVIENNSREIDEGFVGDYSENRKETLESFGVCLTKAAGNNKLDAVIGRSTEIERCIQILGRRTKANPVLIGEAGVGKTSIVEGIAQAIVTNKVPDNLAGKEIWSIDIGGLIAGTRMRGDFEERVQKLIHLAKDSNVILFVDEIHSALGSGGVGSSTAGGVDAANLLKPALARGEIRLIGATTLEEYRQIEKDAALERRLTPVTVEEPSPDMTLKMLQALRESYETHHGIVCENSALEACVTLTSRYVTDRRQPDKAIDALDETLAGVRIKGQLRESVVRSYRDTWVLWTQNNRLKKTSKDKNIKEALNYLKTNKVRYSIQAADVARQVSSTTGIPISTEDVEVERILELEKVFKSKIKGQDEAVDLVARVLRRQRAGLGDQTRVNGAFLFVGPTGVGKSELAKVLAQELANKESSLVQLDMSEYMEAQSIAKLIGAPPGYAGYEEGGTLTKSVKNMPYCVVLFDEIEKAHPEVTNILLQILEEGRLTDSSGCRVDFSNTIVIATSNLGTESLGSVQVGFGSTNTDSYVDHKKIILDAVQKTLRPELIGRFDEIVVFRALDDRAISAICENIVNEVASRCENLGIVLETTDNSINILVKHGLASGPGARGIRRSVQLLVEDRLSNLILAGEARAGVKVLIDANKNMDDLVVLVDEEVKRSLETFTQDFQVKSEELPDEIIWQ